MRRAISEGRAVERPQIAHATSSHGLASAAASVRIGVAKSTKPQTAEATEAALRQLRSKLGGATPDVVLVVLCGANPQEPSPYDLDACLARLRVGEYALAASTKVVATTSCMGIAVESQWVGGNAIALTVASATLTHAPSAFAGSKKGGKNKPEDLLDKIDFAELSKLFGTEFGISGVVGLGVGILGKTVAKFSIMVLASVYAFLRWLELNDIIDVKWKNLELLVGKTSRVVLDVNKDGKVDEKDIYAAKAKAVGFLSSAVPSAAGLSAGIMLGLRIG